ncbi:hypothetical protein M413DRAFT_445221 [Hebeloma cylindrosporum]|uniref:Uncharacterized protein n=1 Tax=Hebeloma cylindrosporum TaxID=76867 RepID=A0A0C2XWK9_HEBCY|nr:hypothetical protein M413DRAFT_445221 [Hebeloma cylindrosporum h7]
MMLYTLATGDPDVHNVKIPTLKAREPQATLTVDPTATNITPSIADSTLQPSPPSNNSNSKSELTKTVVEYLFLGVAVLIVASIILRRLMRLKRANQPYSAFFSLNSTHPSAQSQGGRNFPRTTGLPPPIPGQPYPEPHLSGFPPAYLQYSSRGIRAGDVDSRGRRAATMELDHDGELGDKDALPAYDVSGGPPKYLELEMQARQTRLFGTGSSSHATVDQPGNRLENIVIPRSMPSHGTQQDSRRGNVDTPPDPPRPSDEDPTISSGRNPTTDTARPTLTNDE